MKEAAQENADVPTEGLKDRVVCLIFLLYFLLCDFTFNELGD